jgi:hypothetical protein
MEMRRRTENNNGHCHLFRRKFKINFQHIGAQKYSLIRDELDSLNLVYLEDALGRNGFFSEEFIPLRANLVDHAYVTSVETLLERRGEYVHVFYLRNKMDKEYVKALRKCLEESPNA